MDSILRLASKDRSSFSFRKSGQQNAGGRQGADAASEQLPLISHIDTTSLANLFDRFKSLEQSPQHELMQASTTARDFAWPVNSGMKSAPTLLYHTSPTNIATGTLSNDSTAMPVIRNDSTGSSSLSRRSDTTPPMTRHSSSSSIMPAISPLASEKSRTKTEDPIALPRVVQSDSALGSPIRLQPQRRASTWGSSSSSGSRALNLDKPLPAGPPDHNQKHPNSSARRKHRRVDSLDSATVFQNADQSLQSPTRFESLRRHTRSTSVTFPVAREPSVSNFPASSPPTSRGARLGRAIAQANTGAHVRSKSETLLDGPKLAKNASHRNSAPVGLAKGFQKLQPLRKPPSKPLTARTAEQVIYRIMSQLDTPKDLQSVAMVSKGFLNTYQRNESKLVSHLIFKNSRPAWELRRSIVSLKGSKSFKLLDYGRDLRTIQALKPFILDQCRDSCRPKTLAGLLGEDKQCEREAESALWRIWTFCALFGDNASQNPVPAAELDWLNGSNGTKSRVLGAGFAVGNGEGLTVDELEDMSEMWCCLQALVSQFHDREAEAEKAGVFENWHLNDTQLAHQHVSEWTSYLLTLGPQVILSLSSGSFDRAKVLGLTQWTLPARGQSRSGFLITAISHTYQERLLAEATAKAAQIALPSGPKHRPTKSLPDPRLTTSSPPLRQPSLRIDTQVRSQLQPSKRRTVSAFPTTTAPLEIRPDCDPANANLPHHRPTLKHTHARSVSTSAVSTTFPTLFPASPSTDPTIYHTLNLTTPANTASVKLGATLFPMEYTPTTPRVPFLASPPMPSRAPPPPPGTPGVIDPIDKAMDLLVRELGFKEANAKRALAMCDSGSGVDVERAIELLMVESRREERLKAAPVELPTTNDIVSPMSLSLSAGSLKAGTLKGRGRGRGREYCDGGCKRPGTRSSAASGFAEGRGSLGRSWSTATGVASATPTPKHKPRRSSAEDDEEADLDGNVSPITDIYGGHSDSESNSNDHDRHTLHTLHSSVLDDDSSEIWRRREGNDTISPLVSTTPTFRGAARMSSGTGTQSRKAWKLLGVGERHSLGQPISVDEAFRGAVSRASSGRGGTGSGIKNGLARMRSRSSSSGVVPIEEYAVRVERRRSMRMMQQAEKRGTGGVVSVGLGEQLKGLGLMSVQQAPMSGGLGGFRVVEGMKVGVSEREVGCQVQSDGEGEGGGERAAVGVARRESKWLSVRRTTTKKNLREQGVGCGMPVSPCT